jgi:hypothetical protein
MFIVYKEKKMRKNKLKRFFSVENRVINFLIFYFLIVCLDWTTTLIAINMGYSESNPAFSYGNFMFLIILGKTLFILFLINTIINSILFLFKFSAKSIFIGDIFKIIFIIFLSIISIDAVLNNILIIIRSFN